MSGPSLEERVAIEDLYARYTWALDTGDLDRFAACFTDDALIHEVQPDGTVADHRARPFLQARLDREPNLLHQHWTGSTLFEPDPARWKEDHWQVMLYVSATLADLNDPTTPEHPAARVTWSGYTVDTVVRRDGRWRFLDRRIASWTGKPG